VANFSTDSILRSKCSVKIDTNQGVVVIKKRVIVWNASIVQIWNNSVQPQIWIAYAHMGCKRFIHNMFGMFENFGFNIG